MKPISFSLFIIIHSSLGANPNHVCCQIVEVISLCGPGCQSALEGTEMKLDESGDVTWILPEGGSRDVM